MNDKYVSLGKRIANERKRLGYTQEEIAQLCEVSRVQWGRYEREESELKGRVLKVFCELGANAGYIFTGQKSTLNIIGKISTKPISNKPEQLSDDEWKMIQMYRLMNHDKKITLKETARLFCQDSGFENNQIKENL